MQSTSIFKLFEDISPFIENKKNRDILLSSIGHKILDFLYYLPIKNIESIFCTKWDELKQDHSVVIKVYIKKHYNSYRIRGAPYKISVLFDNKLIYLIFFSKYTGYLKKVFPENTYLHITGKVDNYKNKFQITHPIVLDEKKSFIKKKEIKVFYRQTGGVKTEKIKEIIYKITYLIPSLDEWNKTIFEHYKNLPSWKDAITNIHKPDDIKETEYNSNSYIRLAYDELLATQISLGIIRNSIKNKKSNTYKSFDLKNLKGLTKQLLFDLTKDQESALKEILVNLNDNNRMMRLLHGDVGSGKTVVAFLSALHVINSHYQVAIMVPTEILAKQHFKVAQNIFKNINIRIELLVSSSNNKNQIYRGLFNGEIDLVIGTHALIQSKVQFKNLSYVVIDEQHRFGVEQRLKIRGKGKKVDMLLLSATPIPRTMLLATLGDINLSTIRNKPFNSKINTIIKSEDNIDNVILYLKNFIYKGQKVFWVCPMIDDEDGTKSNIESRFKILKKEIKNIDILHGRLDELKKEEVLDNFKSGKISLLICTIVIEVGVDIPNANIILIDQAERFGMAQIHQLRGRVGRGKEDGVCILLYKSTLKEHSYQRLLAIKETYDGFDIAEKDLALRGGGEVLGIRQYGYQNFVFFDIYKHKILINIAILEANNILKKDPGLSSNRGKQLVNLLYLFGKSEAVDLISAG